MLRSETEMQWKNRSLLYNATGLGWNCSAAMIPTPEYIDDNTLRIYISSCDSFNRSRISYLECLLQNDTPQIVKIGDRPFFEIGERGTFDDNGCVATSIITLQNGWKYLYYVGFELCTNIRYRLFIGLAISKDGGKSFQRYSNTPILDRTDKEPYFRCGPYVSLENGTFRMWYVAGNEWVEIDGKSMPIYRIKYLESKDGIQWGDYGKICIDIESSEEHGFGRPYVIRDAGVYKMFYSKRIKHLGYRMGYAESKDGINWVRKDSLINFEPSGSGWDSEMVCYPSLIKYDNRWIMFYNGNGFGKTGFGYAELQ